MNSSSSCCISAGGEAPYLFVASPFRRLSDGPVITADDLEPGAPGVVLAFNPGVVRLGEQWLAACRADHGTAGDPHIVATSIVFARSDDGLAWRLDPRRPAIDRQTAIDLLQPLEPHR